MEKTANQTKAGSTAAAKRSDNSSSSAGGRKKVSETMKEGALHKFFVDALKDMYWAENALVDALGKMQKAATTEELQDAFEDHALMTKKHITRLDKVFESIDEKAEGKKCDAMSGLIKEGESIVEETPEGSMTRDAALIIAAQKVEHYEIASYGGLVALAKTMNHDKAARLLEQTLNEEEDTDRNLTEIAETSINFEAMEEDDYEEE